MNEGISLTEIWLANHSRYVVSLILQTLLPEFFIPLFFFLPYFFVVYLVLLNCLFVNGFVHAPDFLKSFLFLVEHRRFNLVLVLFLQLLVEWFLLKNPFKLLCRFFLLAQSFLFLLFQTLLYVLPHLLSLVLSFLEIFLLPLDDLFALLFQLLREDSFLVSLLLLSSLFVFVELLDKQSRFLFLVALGLKVFLLLSQFSVSLHARRGRWNDPYSVLQWVHWDFTLRLVFKHRFDFVIQFLYFCILKTSQITIII